MEIQTPLLTGPLPDGFEMNEEQAALLYRVEERLLSVDKTLARIDRNQEKLNDRMDVIDNYRSWATGAFAALVFTSSVIGWAVNTRQIQANDVLQRLNQRVYNICRIVRQTEQGVCDVEGTFSN